MTKPYSFLVRFDIAARIIADGVIFTDDTALDMLQEFLPGAGPREIAATVLVAPSTERISKEQGWPDHYPNQEAHYQQELAEASPRAYDAEDGILPTLTRLHAFELAGFAGMGGDLGAIIDKLTGNDALSDIEWQEAE